KNVPKQDPTPAVPTLTMPPASEPMVLDAQVTPTDLEVDPIPEGTVTVVQGETHIHQPEEQATGSKANTKAAIAHQQESSEAAGREDSRLCGTAAEHQNESGKEESGLVHFAAETAHKTGEYYDYADFAVDALNLFTGGKAELLDKPFQLSLQIHAAGGG